MWGRAERYNVFAGEGVIDNKAAVPNGHLAPSAWVLPLKPGGMGSRFEIAGVGGFAGTGSLGRNIEAALAGTASFSAIGALIVSASAAIAGAASVSASAIGALQMAANLAGTGDAVGAISAVAHATCVIAGVAAITSTIRATGTMEATIEVGAQVGLTAGAVADEILDVQMVETGLSVRDTLRLCVAALAGKISGATGSTITIRNAVGDDTDRIVATVDSNGNRTAITYDLG